jgi:ATP-dependent DNA ligase
MVQKAMLATRLDPGCRPMVMGPTYGMEVKADGHRKLTVTGPNGPSVYNRDGHRAAQPLPAPLFESLSTLTVPAILDGELVQGCLYLFDLVSYDGIVTPNVPFAKRSAALRHLVDVWDPPGWVEVVDPYIVDPDEKQAAIDGLEMLGAEGVVFKRLDSPYIPGKSTAWLKLKFLEDVDAVVYGTGHEGKDNLMLAMADPAGDLVLPDGTVGRDIGRVSAQQGDGANVEVGQVVQVRVGGLGATGRLVEPRKPTIRHDKTPAECGIDQLATLRRINR